MLDLNTARGSLSKRDVGREFHVSGAAQLKVRLPNDVLLKDVLIMRVCDIIFTF